MQMNYERTSNLPSDITIGEDPLQAKRNVAAIIDVNTSGLNNNLCCRLTTWS